MNLRKKIGLVFLLHLSGICAGQQVFYESFDSGSANGVKGNAQLFDGYFTGHTVAASNIPSAQNFTVEAWIAVQEYAANVAAIVDKEKDFKSGYLFGINQYGKLSASFALGEKWVTLISDEAVPLLWWTHMAMVVRNDESLSLYVNGKKSGEMLFAGSVDFCDSCNLSIGKTQTATAATNTERLTSMNIKSFNRFDGLIDELRIHPAPLSDEEIAKNFAPLKPARQQPLAYRQMPSGPTGPSSFGAFYTHLKYAPGWDALWRGSEYPDVVVRFENSPVKFVFWRGTGYIPAVVNEKNMWATDQSLEHYGTGECYEAMGDKQTRYSHIRIIENTAARVVVHWRYALAGIKHQLLPEDEAGWSDWADEYWTIYPDGIAARKQVLWSKRYEKDKGVMQWQETIFFCQPGTRPQDNVETEAITFMDMQGSKKSYSWEGGPPKTFDVPVYKPVEVVNFKARYKPFNIFDEKRVCKPFAFGNMKEYTTFPNWNHWPVQQVASDGRNAVAPDKPSHASLTDGNGRTQIAQKKGEGEYWSCMLKGMTDKPVDSLLALAKSWNAAPAITSLSAGAKAAYDKYQRAYVFQLANVPSHQLSFTVDASPASPVANLALVAEGWNPSMPIVRVNGKKLVLQKDYQVGKVMGLEKDKTLFFIYYKAVKPVRINIMAVK